MDYYLDYLRQVTEVHHVMFEKLLADEGKYPRELAELFEDAGRTYLRISERLSERYLSHEPSDIE